MASGFEVVAATTAIVTTFHKSSIILTMFKEKRNAPEKKHLIARRPKHEAEFKVAEAELETTLHKGADEIRRDFTTYCDRFGKDFSVGDQNAQLRFNEIKEDAKGMYRILEYAKDLDVDDCKKIRSMAENTKYQTQAAMADFQLRLLQKRSANAPPLHVHPAFQNDNPEPPAPVELPTRNSLSPTGRHSPHSESRPSFDNVPIEVGNWPQPPSSNSDQDGERSSFGDIDSRRSTFTSSINSSEDSDYRGRNDSVFSYTNNPVTPMTPMTPLTPTSGPLNFSIPSIRHPSEDLEDHAKGRISPVIEETKSQIYGAEQPTGAETAPTTQPTIHSQPTTPSEPTPRKEPVSFFLAPTSSPEEADGSPSNRSRSRSELTHSPSPIQSPVRSPIRARSPLRPGDRSSGGSLSALGVLPLIPNTLHKRNMSETDARGRSPEPRRSPDTRGAIVAASATLSSITSTSSSSIVESEAPKRSNDYHGFCKGAWKVMDKGTKGLSAERRPIGIGYKAYESFWQCKDCRFQGPMPNPHGKERLPDTKVRYSRSGVQYRWMILAKSHVRAGMINEIPSYRCLVCHYEGSKSDIFKGDENLMEHISEMHGDNISVEIQRRISAVQGRKPHLGEEWDLNIPKRDVYELPTSTETAPLLELDGESGDFNPKLEKDQAPVPASEFASAEAEKVDMISQALKVAQPTQGSSNRAEAMGMLEEDYKRGRSSPTSKPAKILGVDEGEMIRVRDAEAEAEKARKEKEAYRKWRVERAHGSFSI